MVGGRRVMCDVYSGDQNVRFTVASIRLQCGEPFVRWRCMIGQQVFGHGSHICLPMFIRSGEASVYVCGLCEQRPLLGRVIPRSPKNTTNNGAVGVFIATRRRQ